MSDLVTKVKKYCLNNSLLAEKDRIIVGVSGGADSMCLLKVLMELRKELSLTLFVVHVNHCLRGKEADLEQEYVKKFCDDNEVPILVNKVLVSAYALTNNLSTEEAGRILRYQIFEKAAREKNCNRIAIAHNKNDNAETVLFHLFRGTGLDGLSGIKTQRDKIIRPLLFVSRDEIESYVKQQGIHYCTDSSNLSTDYTRNRIRNELLPYVKKEINQQAIEHIVCAALKVGQAAEYLDRVAEKEFDRIAVKENGKLCLSIIELEKLDPVIGNLVIRSAIFKLTRQKDIEQIHIDSVYGLIKKQVGRKVTLPYKLCVKRGYTALYMEILKNEPVVREQPVYEAVIPGIVKIEASKETFVFSIIETHGEAEKYLSSMPKNNYTKWYDYDKIKESVVIRTRQTGDYLVFNKLGGKKKIKSLFIDAKIDQEKRDTIFFAASGHHVLWVPDVKTSQGALVTSDTTRILSITYYRNE